MNQQDVRPATEKQLAFLNAFGFVPDPPLTIVEASDLIQQFTADPARQKICAEHYAKILLKEYDELNKHRAYYVRKDIEDAKRELERELEKAEDDDDIEAAKSCVQDMQYARLDFWADTFEDPVNMQNGTYEQKAKFYFAHGYRFEVPTPEQIQGILDILDANSATWDKDTPEYFFQTLEHNFPQLVRKDVDLKNLAIDEKQSKELLRNLRQIDEESINTRSMLRASGYWQKYFREKH